MMNHVVRAAAGAAVIGLALRAMSWRLVYTGAWKRPLPPLPDAEVIQLAGQRAVHAVLQIGSSEETTVALLHGSGETVANLAPLAVVLREQGLRTLLVEYPGYGASAGPRPTEAAILSDTIFLLEHLERTQRLDRKRLVLVGQSLGASVAVSLAAHGWGTKLVLLSPFTSLLAAARRFGPVPAKWLEPDKYDVLATAPQVTVPALVIHGALDTIVPATMGRRVAQALVNGQLLEIEAGTHHNLLGEHGVAVVEPLVDFIKRDEGLSFPTAWNGSAVH